MAERTTYTPENYQTSFVDFYNMGGIDVQKAPDPDPDASDPPPVTPNILAPVSGESSGTNIFNTMSLSTGQPAFKVSTVDYVDYINNFEKNLENKAKTGVDRSLGDFGKWAAEQAKKPEMMISTAMGMPALGPIMSIMGAKNRQRQYENASKIAATGGTGGTMFKIGGQTISRAPGTKRYEGTLAGVTQEQAAAVEAIGYNFIPGTFKENEVGSEDGGGYQRSGKSGLVQIDGAIMDAYGNIHSASGLQGGTASQASALREKLYVDAMKNAKYSLDGINVADAALEMKQALDAAAKGGIGFFETVRRQDTETYNKNLSGSQQFIQSYLAERHKEKSASDDSEISSPSPKPITINDSGEDTTSGYNFGSREGVFHHMDDSTNFQGYYASPPEDETSGGEDTTSGYDFGGDSGSYQGYFADGGRVGMQMGGTAPQAAPAGFVERPPSQVPEAATVADDKPMSVPEGTFVINAAAVEFAGEGDIAKMLNDAYAKAGKQGSAAPSKEQIDVAVSRGEVIVPPAIAKIIGYDRLEKINNRGKKETSKRIEENGQQAEGASLGGFLRGLFGFGKEEPQLTAPRPDPSEPKAAKEPAPKEGFVDKPAAQPSTPLPKLTPFEQTTQELLQIVEDNKLKGYVPTNNSGVTIGRGFDVGQHSVTDLERMGLDSDVISLLTPYVGKFDKNKKFVAKTGQAARDALKRDPLNFDPNNEAQAETLEEMNVIVQRAKYEDFERVMSNLKLKMPEDDASRAAVFAEFYAGNFVNKRGNLTIRKSFMDEVKRSGSVYNAFQEGIIDKLGSSNTKAAREARGRAEKTMSWLLDNLPSENMSAYRLPKLPKPNPTVNMTTPTPKPVR